jgi:hypothetical protein
MRRMCIGVGDRRRRRAPDAALVQLLDIAMARRRISFAMTAESFAWHALLPIESLIPPHIDDTQDDHILVVDGSLDLRLDGQRHFAGADDLVRMLRGIPHGIFNNAGRLARRLFWVAPTARLFALFKVLHNVADTAEVVRISAAHDVRFLPPSV